MEIPLQNQYDCIVLGTGMFESLLAGAISRSGKTVLHLDQRPCYGSSYATYSIIDLIQFLEEQNHAQESVPIIIGADTTLVPLPGNTPSYLINIVIQYTDPKEPEPEPIEQQPTPTPQPTEPSTTPQQPTEPSTTPPQPTEPSTTPQQQGTEPSTAPQQPTELSSPPAPTPTPTPASPPTPTPTSTPTPAPPPTTTHPNPTLLFPKNEWRRYNIDLLPCLLWSQGPYVELLLRSGVNRYIEFKCMEQVMMFMDNQLQQVPCSKADVFKNKSISLIEKRQLMKFLTSITQPTEEDLASLQDHLHQPFIEFLQSRGLSPILQNYIVYTIALIDEEQTTAQEKVTTETGLNLLKRFLASVGRYGNTPFLVSLYGTSELTQAFCRLSAVYGATYVLQLTAKEILVENGKAIGITDNHGQRILCNHIIGNAEHFSTLVHTDEKKSISRCICITDKALTQTEDLLMIRIPPGTFNNLGAITLIQYSSATMSCPAGKHIIHLTCKSRRATAQEDLQSCLQSLFNHKDNPITDINKPNIIWNCYFNHIHRVAVSPLPENLIITPDPDINIGLDEILEKSESLYRGISPEEEIFISPVPHPEDIVYEPVESDQPPDPVEAGISMDPQ